MNVKQQGKLVLLLDVGNTHTHVGLADGHRIVKHEDMPTSMWGAGKAEARLARFHSVASLAGVSFCSVVRYVAGSCTRIQLRANRENRHGQKLQEMRQTETLPVLSPQFMGESGGLGLVSSVHLWLLQYPRHAICPESRV
jgi:hypothetical protein